MKLERVISQLFGLGLSFTFPLLIVLAGSQRKTWCFQGLGPGRGMGLRAAGSFSPQPEVLPHDPFINAWNNSHCDGAQRAGGTGPGPACLFRRERDSDHSGLWWLGWALSAEAHAGNVPELRGRQERSRGR